MNRLDRKPTAYTTVVDILANVHVSEKPERLQIEKLPAHTQAKIAEAQLNGYRPVCVYWPDGRQAHMLIESNADMPSPGRVVAAYLGCLRTNKIFPEGVTS